MNPQTPPPLPASLPPLDATCDRIVATLIRRLAEVAAAIELSAPAFENDFLVPVLRPDMAEPLVSIRRR